jgi:hypothetical protein
MKCKYLLYFIFFTTSLIIYQSFSQAINVLPGINVEVGEEVYFDAVYYSGQYGDSIQCEWDFGDGYTLMAGYPQDYTFETGLCAIHYFMNPGNFTVNLAVSLFDMSTSPPARGVLLAEDSVTVSVTGSVPLTGFELLHAPYHARTGQYLYVQVPEGYNPSEVTVIIERTGGGYARELTGITEGERQKFLLRNAFLPAGDYLVTAELKYGNQTVSTIRENFSKPYDGAPEVGINENNAFVLNGTTLFFPIAPYMLNGSSIPLWHHCSNTLHTEGWYETHNAATWVDYINQGNEGGMMSIGPSRWEGFIETPYTRNSDPNDLTVYVERAKDSPGLFGWNWDDEPSLGGRYTRVPSHVLTAWNYLTNRVDPQHPSSQQYYGFSYFPHYNPRTGDSGYDFMRSAGSFGGKKHFLADFITHDAYPIEYKEHTSLDYTDRGVIDLWLENLDNYNWNFAELIPLGTFVETQNVTSYQRMPGTDYLTDWDAGPTPGDIRTQMWGAVVHGMKFIGYFEFFSPTPASNMSVMAEFKETITDLTPVILSEAAAYNVTHNAMTRGQRVDLMVRETSTDIYLFAVRISEPASEWSEVPEPETINVQFNTGINRSVVYDDFPKYCWKYMLVDATEGQTDFNLVLPEGAVQPGSIIVSSVRNPVPSEYPATLHDRWTGEEYDAAFDTQGNLLYSYDDSAGNIIPLNPWENVTGTIDYLTGNLSLQFEPGIPGGTGYVQVAYAPANRTSRIIPASDSDFTDQLERNAVRIYRIPKNDSTGAVIDRFELYQNYPNPFNLSTTIRYHATLTCNVKVIIYDLLGRQICILNSHADPGFNTIEWEGKDRQGKRVASGIYFYQLQTGSGFTKTKKMVLLK